MTDIKFYHMQRKKLEQALPEIVGKALKRGLRVVVKIGSEERAQVLDDVLWTHEASSFLPHGRLRDGRELEQPVWLTVEDENPNGATVLILTDGASASAVGDYATCCELFDGADETAVAAARARWTAYKEQGHTVSYFQQDDDGRWQHKQ